MPLVVLAGLATVGVAHQPAVRRTRSSTSSTAGSSPCCAARPRSARRRSAPGSRSSTGRARRSRSSASSSGARVYRNGLDADGADPGVERLGAFAQRARERVLPRRRPRPVRERPGHRVRALPQRGHRPRRDRRRGQRHRPRVPRRGRRAAQGCRPAWCATTRSRSCSARCSLVVFVDDEGDAVIGVARGRRRVARVAASASRS